MSPACDRLLAALVALAVCSPAPRADPSADRALADLQHKVARFQVVPLDLARKELTLRPEQALTADHIRGVTLDERPPALGQPDKAYDPRMTDGSAAGDAPYVAEGVEPFRFDYFHNEFNYGGWHNWAMTDYASAHGFDILYAYNHSPEDWGHVPGGTRWLRWGGFVNWRKWLPEHNIPEGRYDQLADLDLREMLSDAGLFDRDPAFDALMIDMEHGVLPPEKLREQEWYPQGAAAGERQAFEERYYQGYAATYVVPVRTAKAAGWPSVGVYGTAPFGRTWWGLEEAELDPAADWAWNRFGKRIYEAVDVVYPSVYCFYWSPQNVAYVLANVDLNMRLVRSMPVRKPVRPYCWWLLHGGGGGWRWWAEQPMPDEQVEAISALLFLTGVDGLVLWNWSGTGNDHEPPPLEPEADVQLAGAFELAPEGGGEPRAFTRYDVLHVTDVGDDGSVRFQPIQRDKPPKYGIGAEFATYAVPADELRQHLRPRSSPVAAMVRGLALVKPFEYVLRHGEVKADVPAQEQFGETLPIVRRVKLDDIHILATYDPLAEVGAAGRPITLWDFDGHAGLTVTVPTSSNVQVFALTEQA